MTSPDQKPASSPSARTFLKTLHEQYPVLRDHLPLAIGIDKQILAQQPDIDRKMLRQAMRFHTSSTRYLKEMQVATVRHGLDGQPADPVTDEQRQHAAELLRERFKKVAEQRRAEEAAKKAEAAAQQAEARRQEKLGQLAAKFGRRA